MAVCCRSTSSCSVSSRRARQQLQLQPLDRLLGGSAAGQIQEGAGSSPGARSALAPRLHRAAWPGRGLLWSAGLRPPPATQGQSRSATPVLTSQRGSRRAHPEEGRDASSYTSLRTGGDTATRPPSPVTVGNHPSRQSDGDGIRPSSTARELHR